MSKEEVHVRPGKIKELAVGDKLFKSSNDWELKESEIEKSRVDLGETEEKKERCLRELKKKLSEDEHVNYRTDDAYLLRFLRFRKYDVEKAYQNVKQFVHLRKNNPDFFIIPPDLKSVQNLNFGTCLPYTDEEGRTLLWLNVDRWNPQEKSFEEIMQSITTICDIISMNPKCQINGVMGLWDANGLSSSHFTELLRKKRIAIISALGQNAYPWRIHKMIIVNTGRLARIIYYILRPLLSRKIAERVILIGSDMNELHRYVNPALLPKRLGGALDEEECTVTQHIIDNLPYLRYERSFQ